MILLYRHSRKFIENYSMLNCGKDYDNAIALNGHDYNIDIKII